MGYYMYGSTHRGVILSSVACIRHVLFVMSIGSGYEQIYLGQTNAILLNMLCSPPVWLKKLKH